MHLCLLCFYDFDFSSLFSSASSDVLRVNFDVARILGRVSGASAMLGCPEWNSAGLHLKENLLLYPVALTSSSFKWPRRVGVLGLNTFILTAEIRLVLFRGLPPVCSRTAFLVKEGITGVTGAEWSKRTGVAKTVLGMVDVESQGRGQEEVLLRKLRSMNKATDQYMK